MVSLLLELGSVVTFQVKQLINVLILWQPSYKTERKLNPLELVVSSVAGILLQAIQHTRKVLYLFIKIIGRRLKRLEDSLLGIYAFLPSKLAT